MALIFSLMITEADSCLDELRTVPYRTFLRRMQEDTTYLGVEPKFLADIVEVHRMKKKKKSNKKKHFLG